MEQAAQSTYLRELEGIIQERTREIELRREVAEGLRGILTVLNSNRPLAEILEYIVGEARRLLGADAAAIYRLLPENILSIQSSQGLSEDYISRADIPLGRLATGRAVLNRMPVTLINVQEMIVDNEPHLDEAQIDLIRQLASQFQSVLSMPLVIKGEPVGALTLYYTGSRPFNQDEMDLAVAFCDQTALAIENAGLRERLKQEAITAERNRLARDLHDSVTQMLFSASLIAEVLPVVWARDPGEGSQGLTELRKLTRGALAEMRALLLELRPAGLANARLENLLKQLAEAISGRMNSPVSVCIEGQFDLPSEVRLALYRIAQEAFNNIVNHSGATQAEVYLRTICSTDANGDGVELRIRDNGYGFNPENIPSDHLGVSIMRERAASVGANLQITSQPGLGAEVIITWVNNPPST